MSSMGEISKFLLNNGYAFLNSIVLIGLTMNDYKLNDYSQEYETFCTFYATKAKIFKSRNENVLGEQKKTQIIEMKNGLKPSQAPNYYDFTICHASL
jgi:hypothetical protein